MNAPVRKLAAVLTALTSAACPASAQSVGRQVSIPAIGAPLGQAGAAALDLAGSLPLGPLSIAAPGALPDIALPGLLPMTLPPSIIPAPVSPAPLDAVGAAAAMPVSAVLDYLAQDTDLRLVLTPDGGLSDERRLGALSRFYDRLGREESSGATVDARKAAAAPGTPRASIPPVDPAAGLLIPLISKDSKVTGTPGRIFLIGIVMPRAATLLVSYLSRRTGLPEESLRDATEIRLLRYRELPDPEGGDPRAYQYKAQLIAKGDGRVLVNFTATLSHPMLELTLTPKIKDEQIQPPTAGAVRPDVSGGVKEKVKTLLASAGIKPSAVELYSDAPSRLAGPPNVLSVTFAAGPEAFIRIGQAKTVIEAKRGELDLRENVVLEFVITRGERYRASIPFPGVKVAPGVARTLLGYLWGKSLTAYSPSQGVPPFPGAFTVSSVKGQIAVELLGPGGWALYRRGRAPSRRTSLTAPLDPQDYYLVWEGAVAQRLGR